MSFQLLIVELARVVPVGAGRPDLFEGSDVNGNVKSYDAFNIFSFLTSLYGQVYKRTTNIAKNTVYKG